MGFRSVRLGLLRRTGVGGLSAQGKSGVVGRSQSEERLGRRREVEGEVLLFERNRRYETGHV